MVKLQDDKDSGRQRFRKIKLQEGKASGRKSFRMTEFMERFRKKSFCMTKLQEDKA
jgi:hypothetical protein